MENSFLDAALAYAAQGYRVFPCRPGRKLPHTTHGRNDATTDEDQIRAWWEATPTANIGLVTDGLLVVDVDGGDNNWPTNPELAADLCNAPTSATPSGGRHHVYRQPAGREYRSTAGRLAEKVDTRANGGYIVAPPSTLEDGKSYQWIDGLELEPLDRLPEPPAWLVQMLDALAQGRGPGAMPQGPILGDSNPIPDGRRNYTLARLAGTMRRAGMSRGEIASALHRANQDRCCPPLCESEVERIADSISRYEPDQITVAVVEGHWGQMAEELPDAIGPIDPGPFPAHLLEVPGLLATSCEYMLASSHRPQPILALGASLSLLSVITGRRVMDEIGTRPNLYSLGVAPSGAGKEAPRSAVKEILWQAGAGAMLGESIASHAGLVTHTGQQPSMVWLIDEIGRWLRGISAAGDKAPHLTGIITNFMKFYTSSHSVYLGDAYADISKRIEIHQPNVVLFGTTVPESLYQGLTADSVADGFLSRVLIWEGPNTRPRKRKPKVMAPPADLVELVRMWCNWTPGTGNLAGQHPRPMVIPSTREAGLILDEFDEKCDKAQDQEERQLATLWSRGAEKARKLALLHTCSRMLPGEAAQIDAEAAHWAIELAGYLTQRLIYLAYQWVADGAFDGRRKRVLRAIQASGQHGLTGSELCRKTQSLSPRERAEVLEALLQSGEIRSALNESSKPGRKTLKYFCHENTAKTINSKIQ